MRQGPSGPLSGQSGVRGAAVQLWSASVRFTGRAEGDMGHGGRYVLDVEPDVEARRRAVVDAPWTWLRQVHGADVVEVRGPGDGAGTRADAAVTTEAGCALAVLTADCAPVALSSPEGVIGVAHAGWMGLLAGVLERTVDRMRALGASEVAAVVGPCIRAECYEFGTEHLDRVAARLGEGVRGTSATGTPALDVPAAARSALATVGVSDVVEAGRCTACDPDYFSWRAGGEMARQAVVAWR
ncbi:MAG: polyphenol oxidase family protein [Actinomycetota bacterium]|nr:polyphenol oxidase family protein [Actinomycetota bacterium]